MKYAKGDEIAVKRTNGTTSRAVVFDFCEERGKVWFRLGGPESNILVKPLDRVMPIEAWEATHGYLAPSYGPLAKHMDARAADPSVKRADEYLRAVFGPEEKKPVTVVRGKHTCSKPNAQEVARQSYFGFPEGTPVGDGTVYSPAVPHTKVAGVHPPYPSKHVRRVGSLGDLDEISSDDPVTFHWDTEKRIPGTSGNYTVSMSCKVQDPEPIKYNKEAAEAAKKVIKIYDSLGEADEEEHW